MSIIHIDTWARHNCRMGIMSIEISPRKKFHCFTLELPYKNNAQHISSIPRGPYDYYIRYISSNGKCIELRDVPDRTYIQIHSGNYTSEIQGCILVGDSIKFLNNDNIPDVTNSRDTLRKILEIIDDRGVVEIF